MAFQIINSILSWLLKKRKHQIELFLKYPKDVQEEVLLRLVNTAKNTEFGIEKEFATIQKYTDFSQKVPIQQYETFEPFIERCRKGAQ
ncbi:GH3 auxin-responsive promoter family protein, partial [Polaribacter sp.]|nr:GH3 auxin-responsive promoter family protein [Polaribacter sp.]